MNQGSVTKGYTGSSGKIDFLIDDYLIRKENIILLPSSETGYYRYSIIKKEQFNEPFYQNIIDSHRVRAELPEKYSYPYLYYIDGEETDFETFSENVNGNPEDFLYFLLPPELACILLEEETKKSMYIAYRR